MADSETIVAPATAQGKSALAVLRISGIDAIGVAARCVVEKEMFLNTPLRTIRLFSAKDPRYGRTIDQITCIKYHSPNSFTGEDMVEVICHGGSIIIQKLFEALIAAGARPAGSGEFTRRALLNGKIDVLKAEAIGALIESSSENELTCAQRMYEEKVKELALWRDEVLGILERIETNIEFNEGVSDGVPEDRGKGSMEVFLERLKQDIERRKRMRLIEHGVKVVIAGPVNAGKSTLFNTLIKKNRAIVHRTPGTTRDIVSERLWLSGHEIRLYDSAGIRKTGHDVEREGIERSRRAMRDAGVILWVTAADEKLKSMETKEVVTRAAETETICIINKTDINDGRVKANEFENRGIKTFFLSLKEGNKKKIDQFVSYLEKNIEAMHHDQQLPEMLFNARHEEIGKALIRELSRAGEEWERPEIAAIFLKRGLACMDEYFGKVHSEEVLNGIFKNFCIGK